MILEMRMGGESLTIIQTIISLILYFLAIYIVFWIHDLGQSLVAKIFDKDQKLVLNPLKQIKSMSNIISSIIFLIFAVGWKNKIEQKCKRRIPSFFVSISGVFVTFLSSIIFFISYQLLMMLSGESFYALLIYPLVLLFSALFTTSLAVAVFSLFPLPPFDGGYIIHSILPTGLGEKFLKIKDYSIYIIIILSAFFARSGLVKNLFEFFATIIHEIYAFIF